MKISICADLHLNNNSYGKIIDDNLPIKISDNIKSFKFFVDKSIENKVDEVVIAGDVYENHAPNNKVRNIFNCLVQELLSKDIRVSILVGNHDSCMEHNAIDPLFGWNDKLRVVNDVKSEIKDDINFLYLPHTKDIENKKTTFKNSLSTIKGLATEGGRNILFGHFAVSGCSNNDFHKHFNNQDPSAQDLDSLGFEAIFLGHFHKRNQIIDNKNIYYVGSLERQSFSEKDQEKGFCIYDTDTKELSWINYDARKMCEISVDNYEELLDAIEKTDVENSIVKIKVTGDEFDYAYIQQRYNYISSLISRNKATFFKGLEKPKVSSEEYNTFKSTVEQSDNIDIYNIIESEIRSKLDGCDEEEVNRHIKLLQEISQKVNVDSSLSTSSQLTGKKTIRFKWAKYHNFCRFGTDNNIVDFDKLFGDSNGIASICGMVDSDEGEANGAGKSSLLEGIAYALYGKMPRLCSLEDRKKATTTEIIRTDDYGNYACHESYVELCISVEEDEWTIKRGRKLNKAQTTHTPILELFKNGESYNACHNKEPDQVIVDLIGIEFEPFCNSVFFAQKDSSKIFTSTPGSRIDTILNVLGILRTINLSLKFLREDKKKQNKEEIIKLEGQVSILDSENFNDNKIEIEKNIIEDEKALKLIEESVKIVIESIEKENGRMEIEQDSNRKIKAEASSLESEIKIIKNSEEKDKESLLLKEKQLLGQIEKEKEDIQTFELKKNKLKAEYVAKQEDIKKIDINECKSDISKIEGLKVQFKNLEAERKSLNDLKLKKIEQNNIIKIKINEDKSSLIALIDKVKNIESKIKESQDKIDNLDIENDKALLKNVENAKEELLELEKSKKELAEKNQAEHINLERVRADIDNVISNINKYQGIIDSGGMLCPYCGSEQDEDKLNSQIKKLGEEKNTLDEKMTNSLSTIKKNNQELDLISNKINSNLNIVKDENELLLRKQKHENFLENIKNALKEIDSIHKLAECKDGQEKILIVKNYIENEKEIIQDKLNQTKDKEIVSISEQIEEIEKTLSGLNNDLSKEKILLETLSIYQNYENDIKNIKQRAEELKDNYKHVSKDRIAEITAEKDKITLKIKDLEEKYSKKIEGIEIKKERLDASLACSENKIKDIKNNIEKNNIELNTLNKQKQDITLKISECKIKLNMVLKNIEKISVIRKRLYEEYNMKNVISTLENMFGSEGIKNKIADIYVPVFNTHLDNFMSVLTEGRISVTIDSQKMIPVIKGGSSSNYNMLSGGEQDIIRLASNTALGMVSLGSSKALPDTLFLDEVFGSLAPAMQERVFLLLKHLRVFFARILVITHIPSLQERFQRKIRVEKNGGISSIRILGV